METETQGLSLSSPLTYLPHGLCKVLPPPLCKEQGGFDFPGIPTSVLLGLSRAAHPPPKKKKKSRPFTQEQCRQSRDLWMGPKPLLAATCSISTGLFLVFLVPPRQRGGREVRRPPDRWRGSHQYQDSTSFSPFALPTLAPSTPKPAPKESRMLGDLHPAVSILCPEAEPPLQENISGGFNRVEAFCKCDCQPR